MKKDETDMRDAALIELYQALVKRGAPAPGSFSSLSSEERRAYHRDALRRHRQRESAARQAGSPQPTTTNVREALADAALMILAADAPGIDQVRKVLAQVFEKRPGVPLSVEMKAKKGKLRTKLIARSE